MERLTTFTKNHAFFKIKLFFFIHCTRLATVYTSISVHCVQLTIDYYYYKTHLICDIIKNHDPMNSSIVGVSD